MKADIARVLILFAHPAIHNSRVHRRLIDAVRDLDSVTIHDLYEVYPDLRIDVRLEQRLLLDHEIVVLQHPFYWYSGPAILKEWEDLVLEHGFAYGVHGQALRGKQLLSAITAGGPADSYRPEGFNHFSVRQLLTPFEQMARLCGMEYLPPWVMHNTHRLGNEEIEWGASVYREAIQILQDRRVQWVDSPEGLRWPPELSASQLPHLSHA